MTWVYITGSVNSLLVLVSVYGVWLQLNTIWLRRNGVVQTRENETPTAVLSVNQFLMSFLAYFSFFCYGLALSSLNHFLVWPRVVACVLVVLIIREIAKDRPTRAIRSCQYAAFTLLILSGIMLILTLLDMASAIPIFERSSANVLEYASVLIVLVALLLAQGYLRQILKIIKTGATGAVDIRMSQFLFVMDLSTLAFGLSLGIINSWPLLFLASVSAITKLTIMYLFLWVRISKKAASRRARFFVNQ